MDWAHRTLQTDTNRVYLFGSSMGGCGSISMALHHPGRIAAVSAHVPAVSYTPPIPGYEKGTDWRIAARSGPLAGNAPTDEGMTVLERMNAVACIEKAGDLPFIYMVNGRQDDSIPWYNNPPFYDAMNRMRQGFVAYWDNGGHGDAGRDAPADARRWGEDSGVLLRFNLKESFPAFSNSSDNRQAGNGQREDGDVVGWINRGLDWKDVIDEETRYGVSVRADYPGLVYPVTVGLTPRRAQKFKPTPGATVHVIVEGRPATSITCGTSGLVTAERIILPSAGWVHVELNPMKP
jgi:pimeloyl-ACP methyl ester carboxylesterase